MSVPQELHILLESINNGFESIQKGFDEYQNGYFSKKSGEFFCLELNGEAGELANLEKKRWKGKDIAHEAIADEAADVFITLCNYANARNINLAEAVRNKLVRIEKKRQLLAENNEAY